MLLLYLNLNQNYDLIPMREYIQEKCINWLVFLYIYVFYILLYIAADILKNRYFSNKFKINNEGFF